MVCSVSTTDSSGQSDFEHLQDGQAEEMEAAVVSLLEAVGEDIAREGLRETPRRVAKAWRDLLQGYRQSPSSAIGDAIFHLRETQQHSQASSCSSPAAASPSGLVLVRDIDFTSISRSSLLPFWGRCHVAYLPRDGVVLGLSKFARLTVLLSKRLQSQHQLAADILSIFVDHVMPHGAAVIIEAMHLDGNSHAASHICHAAHGSFAESGSHDLREVMALLNISHHAAGPAGSDPSFMTSFQHASDIPGARPLPVSVPVSMSSTLPLQPRHRIDEQDVSPSQQDISPSQRHGNGMTFAQSASAPGWEDDFDMDVGPRAVQLAGLPHQQAAIAEAVLLLLEGAGADVPLQDMLPGAVNYARLLLQSTAGHHLQLPKHLQQQSMHPAAAQIPADPHIVEAVLPFSSQCEHHILPFQGTVYMAYSIGLGCQQIPRQVLEQLLAVFSKRLQIQERLNRQLADTLLELSGGGGCMVVCKASHMCMVARGIEKHASSTVTTAARGSFAGDAALRTDCLTRLSSLQML